MSHQEIVEVASSFGAPPWWGQMVTVAFEQHIGRRAPGQRGDGSFSISANKTRPGSLDDALARWREVVGSPTEISGVALERGPEVSSTPKWRYWRCVLSDGSRVQVNFSQKTPEKASISVQHEQLASPDEAEHWRAFWKDVLRDV